MFNRLWKLTVDLVKLGVMCLVFVFFVFVAIMALGIHEARKAFPRHAPSSIVVEKDGAPLEATPTVPTATPR